ncbi:MAG: HIT domain-containing protein [Brevinematales bacterium]|nr:HIT domain-containing protein [Brevinematales bacterium]
MNFNSYVFPFSKKEYIRGKKPDVECILCAIVNNDNRVQSLEILRTENFILSLNLFPYNNGHAIIFPIRHITDIRELSEKEDIELARLTKSYISLLEELYKPSGYNIGYNLGEYAGASIPHLHLHIIPRYQNELGVIDLIGGAKVLVENPLETLEKIKKHIKNKHS